MSRKSNQPFANLRLIPMSSNICIVIFGASGDLARRKIFPALWSLFLECPKVREYRIIGYARTKMSTDDLVEKFVVNIKNISSYQSEFNKFVSNIEYIQGEYDQPDGYKRLSDVMDNYQKDYSLGNRVFYLSLPPQVYVNVCQNVKSYCCNNSGWIRIVAEKPFGRDSKTFKELSSSLSTLFSDYQIFRMDHYLGKEMVQNLMVMKYANTIFMPLWNCQYVSSVMITLKENFGIEGRLSYDNIGVIRDVIQNHSLQVMTLIAMEPPSSLSFEDIKRQKNKLLQEILPIQIENVVLGQYVKRNENSQQQTTTGPESVGYTDTHGISNDSSTPTFASIVCYIDNRRWSGVPFILKTGKALNERKAEVRIQFKMPQTSCLFDENQIVRNELVIRLQPSEAIYAKFLSKKPGRGFELTQTELDLTYHERMSQHKSLEAYEKLILDVFEGNNVNFVTGDELERSWGLFTPLLDEIERKQIRPFSYEYGSRGPKEADALAERVGFIHDPKYEWIKK